AFLLFQVQPLIGKYILPWFGGGPAVWTTCMLFFQALLLAGYAYAHAIRTYLAQRTQVVVHVVVILAAAAMLPIIPSASWKPEASGDPTWHILALLAASVGLPYFVLATTGPLLQAWFSASYPGRSPYRLYALSNLGSLLALLSYPFLVEPLTRLRHQAIAWSLGFAVFGLLCARSAVQTWRLGPVERDDTDDPAADAEPPPTWPVRLMWLALAACGSLLLLAVTSHLCWDVAVVPFLWIVPLSLYLFSFVVCFDNPRWYARRVFWPALVVAVCQMVWLLSCGAAAKITWQILGYCGGLFVCCMVCHGELARLKPRPRHLTSFYLTLAAGGALGGVFATLVAPHIFVYYIELHIGLWLCCGLVALIYWRERGRARRWLTVAVSTALLLLLAYALGADVQRRIKNSLWLSRNFYGVLRVTAGHHTPKGSREKQLYYKLQHGRINHGIQFADEALRRRPVSYYGEKSGIGLALRHARRGSPLRIGVIGLGTGTLAVYGQPGDVIRFYEIDPDVVRLARTRFTYLEESAAQCDVVLGDARLSLERELQRGEAQQFDVFAIDAFNSDAIPVHLLTREAFSITRRHLKPDGIIVVHITNRYLDLRPVIHGLGNEFGYRVAVIRSKRQQKRAIFPCVWAIVTQRDGFLDHPEVSAATSAWDEDWPLVPRLWTDDYTNLFQILRGRARH
ncbi:fused MFS/spermidine synthase, partial [bacterium]|nr:fused MFS/spermidine synthase [bacterium]